MRRTSMYRCELAVGHPNAHGAGKVEDLAYSDEDDEAVV